MEKSWEAAGDSVPAYAEMSSRNLGNGGTHSRIGPEKRARNISPLQKQKLPRSQSGGFAQRQRRQEPGESQQQAKNNALRIACSSDCPLHRESQALPS